MVAVQSGLIPPSPYSVWQKGEGIPILDGMMIENMFGDLPMAHWNRKGGKGAFIKVQGGEESLDATVLEIPAAGATKPEKFMYEEEILVLSGKGATTIWLPGGKKQTFEWQEGSVFSPPINCWRQHFSGSASEPARLLSFSNAPVIFNLFRSADYIFNCDHVFRDRFSGEEGFFSGKGEARGERVWRTNFIPDVFSFGLKDHSGRGAGGTGIMFEMSNNTMESHIAAFPVGTYKKAHRHGPGAHILILSGKGFTLMWEEGKPKQKLDWGPGAFFAPPDMWFHQHFNSGTEPARYFAVHYGYWRVVFKDMGPVSGHSAAGHQIDYENEDPDVLKTFLSELRKNGAAPMPMETWRK